ncbi:amidoligase family protein [Maritimibacter sp. 55A14]|uniref:amidoligase family protein n=1 Tax=Maritimibacter sp. 55A14 TaxID=2174844 RepID=UPI001304A9C8|nr:amidoligase family protein [Maritimibacter sp. 55A14]
MAVHVEQAPDFAALPDPLGLGGAPRRVGVEIEFGGLDTRRAGELVQARFGGRLEVSGPQDVRVRGTKHGDFEIYLDARWRDAADTPLKKAGLELGRAVIPVEIVTPPLPVAALPDLERLRADLRAAGALGSRDGLLLGFGLHFNPEVPALEGTAPVHILTAFALIEDWLRKRNPIDISRRLLPFTDPYPRSLIDALADGWPDLDLDGLFDVYAAHRPSRNRGLDMLPLLAHLDRARFDRLFGDQGKLRARPTFHYRLPDCRIDEPGYSLAAEWNQWVLVERVAADAEAMADLTVGWDAHRNAFLSLRPDWARQSGEILRAHGHAGAQDP